MWFPFSELKCADIYLRKTIPNTNRFIAHEHSLDRDSDSASVDSLQTKRDLKQKLKQRIDEETYTKDLNLKSCKNMNAKHNAMEEALEHGNAALKGEHKIYVKPKPSYKPR